MIAFAFLEHGSISWGLAVLSLAITIGLALGAIRVRGLRLGVSGVLFAALLFGQLGLTVKLEVLDFLRDFSLIIFVYAIGLQVGPGFLVSLRDGGLRLNVLSIFVLLLGALMTGLIVRLLHLPPESATGLYSGGYTTTPGLGAGQEAIAHMLAKTPQAARDAVARAGLAYAVTYPFGLIGPILVIAALRKLFGINMKEEAAALAASEAARRPGIEFIDVEITNAEQAGMMLKDQMLLRSSGVRFSRLMRNGVESVPTGDTIVLIGDQFRAYGRKTELHQVIAAMGKPSAVDFDHHDGEVQRKDFIVTSTRVLRQPLHALDIVRQTGVTIARVNRAGIELLPTGSLRLQFGDRVTAIGNEHGLKTLEHTLGNCPDVLNRPQLVPIFLGIVLGVLVGSIPIWVPGLDTRLRIGLAGGPLIAAIVLSQLGNIGSVVWYMPPAANQLFRDFGLAIFLACVGLESGDHFLQRVQEHGGVPFIFFGAIITVIPITLVAIFARMKWKTNFITLSGWMSGALTSTTGLLFANEIAGSDAPSVAYAAVAPLAMLTPIICAQLLVIFMV